MKQRYYFMTLIRERRNVNLLGVTESANLVDANCDGHGDGEETVTDRRP